MYDTRCRATRRGFSRATLAPSPAMQPLRQRPDTLHLRGPNNSSPASGTSRQPAAERGPPTNTPRMHGLACTESIDGQPMTQGGCTIPIHGTTYSSSAKVSDRQLQRRGCLAPHPRPHGCPRQTRRESTAAPANSHSQLALAPPTPNTRRPCTAVRVPKTLALPHL